MGHTLKSCTHTVISFVLVIAKVKSLACPSTHLLSFIHLPIPPISPQNVPIVHPSLKEVLDPVMELHEDVKRKALLRLEYENLTKCEAITTSTSKFYQKPAEYAMHRYAYYVCFKCKKVWCLAACLAIQCVDSLMLL